MTIIEKIAYLKGLMKGLDFEANTPEQKIISSVVDILDDMAKTIEDVEDNLDYINDYVEELDEDLGEVEEYLYDDFGYLDDDYYDDDDYDDDDDDDDDEDDDENEIYEIDCPECGEKIFLSEELVDNEEIICPLLRKHRGAKLRASVSASAGIGKPPRLHASRREGTVCPACGKALLRVGQSLHDKAAARDEARRRADRESLCQRVP